MKEKEKKGNFKIPEDRSQPNKAGNKAVPVPRAEYLINFLHSML